MTQIRIFIKNGLVAQLENYVKEQKANLIFNPLTNQLFSKSFLVSELLKCFFDSGLSLGDFCKKFPSLKIRLNREKNENQ